MLRKPRFLPVGESALVVEFGATIDPKIHDCVLALNEAIQQGNIEGVTETVPTYRSLMIHFDPHRLTAEGLIDAVAKLRYEAMPLRMGRQRWHIPACYDPPHGEDIAEAAALYVDPYSPEDLTRGLREVAALSGEQRQRLAARARQRALTFTWEHFYDGLAEVIRNHVA